MHFGQPVVTEDDEEGEVSMGIVSHEVSFTHYSISKVRDETQIEKGMWLSEAALWIDWANTGRLISSCLSYLYAIDSNNLARMLGVHPDACAIAVLYARKFIETLLTLEHPSDL